MTKRKPFDDQPPVTPMENDSRIFEFGRFWLGREGNTSSFYIYWYDKKQRRVARMSTRLSDLEAAKRQLVVLALKNPPDGPRVLEDINVASITYFYLQHHGNAMRSKEVARRAFKLIREYLQLIPGGRARLSEFSVARQHSFIIWCRDQHHLTAKTISTYLTYFRAACRFAALPRLVKDHTGVERETQFIAKAPHVIASEAQVAKITGQPRSRPRQWVPSDKELAATIDAIQDEHIFRYVILALNTWARPEAICQLSVVSQVDFNTGLIHLNPLNRLQNNKVRPTIKLTNNLRGWLLHWNIDRPLVFNGRPVSEINNRSLQKAARRAGIADALHFNKYCLRHYMATRVRRVPAAHVSREERASWMGHIDPKHRTTEKWYESFDPDYLETPSRATDAIMRTLDSHTTRDLFAPNTVPGRDLHVISR